MRLSLDPEAAAFIRAEGGHVVVTPGPGGGCCTTAAQLQPQAELGRPHRPADEYRVMEADGVTVYIDRALDHGTDASYRLPLSRFLRHRYLEVSFEGH